MASSSTLNADDLGCWMRSCRGDVPPPLVGASLTFYEPPPASGQSPQIFLFGGRLVDARKMMNHLYVLDLRTLVWSVVVKNGEGEETGPSPRYFHSMEVWRDQLVMFGGMGYSTFVDESPTPNLVGLSDTFFFDILSSTWRVLSPSSPSAFEPSPRYAHISAVTKNRLVVVGGQDLNAAYVQEVGVFDLENEMWIMMQDMGGGRVEERGMYRSSCVAEEKRRGVDGDGDGGKADLYLYSNYNFTDVRRVLEVLKPSAPPPSETFSLFDRSPDLRGDSAKSSPQGLRFPSGAKLGNWLLFGGIYLANSIQEYCLWALDLTTLDWKQVEIGQASAMKGFGNRGILDPISSSYLVFGAKGNNMLEDYNKRATNYSHVVSVDLESFGVYRRPNASSLDRRAKISISELEDDVGSDFQIICEDGRRVFCSRRILEERWPWFAVQTKPYNALATSGNQFLEPSIPPRPSGASQALPRARVRNSQINLQEPYPVVLALTQYFYSLALDTKVQNAPPVLSGLLVLSSQYQLPHLRLLVLDKMHKGLDVDSAEGIAEVASICQCESLCIRAWRILGSGQAVEKKGALSAVKMTKGGGSRDGGGGSGGGRDVSHDLGFESGGVGLGLRGAAGGRGSGGGGSRANAGPPLSVFGLDAGFSLFSSSPMSRSGSVQDALFLRRGNDLPASGFRGASSPPDSSSSTDYSTDSSLGYQTRPRSNSEASSINTSLPQPQLLTAPIQGFHNGRDPAASLSRTGLLPSPLSTSTTGPEALEISRYRLSNSPDASGNSSNVARSPGRSTVSSHGPFTPNEQETFPFFPDTKMTSLSHQGHFSQMTFISEKQASTTDSSSAYQSSFIGSEQQQWKTRSPGQMVDALMLSPTSPRSVGSDGASTLTTSTSSSSKPSGISKMFKKRPSTAERAGETAPVFAESAMAVGRLGGRATSSRGAGAARSHIKLASKVALPLPPVFKHPNSPTSDSCGLPSSAYVSGLFDAPSRPKFQHRGSSSGAASLSPPTIYTTRSGPDSPSQSSSFSTSPSPSYSSFSASPFGLASRSNFNSNPSSSNSNSTSSGPKPNPFDLATRPPPPASYPDFSPTSSLAHKISLSTLRTVSSPSVRSDGSSSRKSNKPIPPKVFAGGGRGGAGARMVAKPDKTPAEKLREKEEKKAKKEEIKRAVVFERNSRNPARTLLGGGGGGKGGGGDGWGLV